jgi:hypothetical protein
MDEIDSLVSRINDDVSERKAFYSAWLSETEERFSQAEADTWRAFELVAADDVAEANRRFEPLLKRNAELRAELNVMWQELDKPAPDFSVFRQGTV